MIGTLLNIAYTQSGEIEPTEYYSKIIEHNDEFLYIDYPVNKDTHKTAFLPIGSTLAITFIGNDEQIYYFRSQLIERVKMNVPALAIKQPSEGLKRIQRREFVRVETAVDIAVHPLDSSFPAFTTVTQDISGGGVSIILPKEVNLDAEREVEIWMVLTENTGETHYLQVKAKTVLIKTGKNSVKTGSFQFTTISKQDQQQIIRYCFDKQRERRKKEMSL